MASETLSIGNHAYKISTVPVAEGGWTITIVHRHDSGAAITETRHDSDVVYDSEEAALEQGLTAARQMAERRAG